MNKLIIAFTLFITIGSCLTAQNNTSSLTEEQQQTAKDIAVQWFTLLTAGDDIPPLLEISTIPFSIDAKKTVESTEELTAFYNEVVHNKGKRKIPEINSKIVTTEDISINKPILENALITEITISNEEFRNKKIYVFIDISKEKYKVIGFID